MVAIRRNLHLDPCEERVERSDILGGGKSAPGHGASEGTRHGVAHGMSEREPEQGVSRQRGGARGGCR